MSRSSLLRLGRSCSPALIDRCGQRSSRTHFGGGLSSESGRCAGRFRPAFVVLVLTVATISGIAAAAGQDERRTRVPVIGKTTGGASRQAFSGKVQSLDLERKLLKVDTVEGGATEIFPVKKNTPVSLAGGRRIKLQELVPGTDVIVYFEQKRERRSVTEIVVLAASGDEDKKKESPPPT